MRKSETIAVLVRVRIEYDPKVKGARKQACKLAKEVVGLNASYDEDPSGRNIVIAKALTSKVMSMPKIMVF